MVQTRQNKTKWSVIITVWFIRCSISETKAWHCCLLVTASKLKTKHTVCCSAKWKTIWRKMVENTRIAQAKRRPAIRQKTEQYTTDQEKIISECITHQLLTGLTNWYPCLLLSAKRQVVSCISNRSASEDAFKYFWLNLIYSVYCRHDQTMYSLYFTLKILQFQQFCLIYLLVYVYLVLLLELL